jgi:hypothetical protein
MKNFIEYAGDTKRESIMKDNEAKAAAISNTPTNNEENASNLLNFTDEIARAGWEHITTDTPNGWQKEFISRFFVSRLNDNSGKAPHVGAQHDAVTYISSLLESARSDERKKTVRDIYNGCKHYSNGNDDFAGTWIDIYAKQHGISLSE